MKDIYLATHGKRNPGFDPIHTKEGLNQLENLAELLLGFDAATHFKTNIQLIIVGYGTRFEEMYSKGICTAFPHLHPKYNRLLGSPISRSDEKGTICLAPGREIPLKDYIPLHDVVDIISAWKAMRNMGNFSSGDTLLCTGREWLLTLGMKKNHPFSNNIYRADLKKHKITCIVENGIELHMPYVCKLREYPWRY